MSWTDHLVSADVSAKHALRQQGHRSRHLRLPGLLTGRASHCSRILAARQSRYSARSGYRRLPVIAVLRKHLPQNTRSGHC